MVDRRSFVNDRHLLVSFDKLLSLAAALSHFINPLYTCNQTYGEGIYYLMPCDNSFRLETSQKLIVPCMYV